MLYYLPLEPYEQRYTKQMSAANTGWFEKFWQHAGVFYNRVEGVPTSGVINNGQVLDATGRCKWAMSQVTKVLEEAESGRIRTGYDAIYFDDFFHPGIESLFYAFDQMNIRIPFYSFLWAQSVDKFDFTYKMKNWIRHFERGIYEKMSKVFVASTQLKELLYEHFGTGTPVYVVGLPFDDPAKVVNTAPRANSVVWSSRLDKEKDPMFFMDVMDYVINTPGGEKITFDICTSAPEFKSNCLGVLPRLFQMAHTHDANVVIHTGLAKDQYYSLLNTAKVQFNCANQDWVSFTLLEATSHGCFPLYPRFRSFPETFLDQGRYMYTKGRVKEAGDRIIELMGQDLWTKEEIEKRNWIWRRFQSTIARISDEMNLLRYPEEFGKCLDMDIYNQQSVENALNCKVQ